MALKWPLRSLKKCQPYVLFNYASNSILIKYYLYEKKHNYYSNIKVISKKNEQDLAFEINGLGMTSKVIRKTLSNFINEGNMK